MVLRVPVVFVLCRPSMLLSGWRLSVLLRSTRFHLGWRSCRSGFHSGLGRLAVLRSGPALHSTLPGFRMSRMLRPGLLLRLASFGKSGLRPGLRLSSFCNAGLLRSRLRLTRLGASSFRKAPVLRGWPVVPLANVGRDAVRLASRAPFRGRRWIWSKGRCWLGLSGRFWLSRQV